MATTSWAAPRTVTLVDGREVSSDSPEWLLECLARTLLRKPLPERRAWLAEHEQIHGAAAAAQLSDVLRAVHEAGMLLGFSRAGG